MERPVFNDTNPNSQLGIFLLFSFAGFLVFFLMAYILSALFFKTSILNLTDLTNYQNIEVLKFIQIVFSTGLFIIVPVILAYLFSGNSFRYLKVVKFPTLSGLGLVIIIMITAIPLINLLASLNSRIKFPAFMSGLEKYLIDSEKANDTMTEVFLNVKTLPGFAVNILMIAIIPAIGEEFFFRGILQRILTNLSRNYHTGIIITAFIFSAIHMQFYGFFPRWLLGIMFGYMFVWSGNLWLPILAHFINNSLDVLAYYLVNAKLLNPKILDFGSPKDFTTVVILITIVMSAVMCLGLYALHKNKLQLSENINNSNK